VKRAWPCDEETFQVAGGVYVQLMLRQVEGARGEHGLTNDRGAAALAAAGAKQWADHEDGLRRTRLWTLTDAGRARLMLEPAE